MDKIIVRLRKLCCPYLESSKLFYSNHHGQKWWTAGEGKIEEVNGQNEVVKTFYMKENE